MGVPQVVQADHWEPSAASLRLEALGEAVRVDRLPVRLPEDQIVLVYIAGTEGEPFLQLPPPVLGLAPTPV